MCFSEGHSQVTRMLDLVAALEWVRDNIEHFAGDPDRVTLVGQSGGGWKLSTLLGMRAARGLFHRAVVQSGSWSSHIPREAAAQVTRGYLQKLGLTRETLESGARTAVVAIAGRANRTGRARLRTGDRRRAHRRAAMGRGGNVNAVR
jgi:carboxylesterase type B